jgi:nucleoside 2-deoxyribosyltransferase
MKGFFMKIYIAGKITGNPDYKNTFKKWQEKLEDKNFTVLNPAVLPEGMKPADYMRICFAMIDCADVVALLPGWQNSSGAILELEYCKYIGKTVLFIG